MEGKNKWRTIYPQYINSNLTIQLGRRLPKEKCVPNPRLGEIHDVLKANPKIEVQAFPEKCYNREVDKENPVNRGYIKYICHDPTLKNKRQVLIHAAKMIPKLKSRINAKPVDANAGSSSSTPAVLTSTQPQAQGNQGGGGGGGGGKKKNRRK